MTSAARIGFATLFQTGDGGNPETFATVAEVSDISPPSFSRDSVDVSHEQSPDQWREFIAGLKDAGEVSFEFNFVPGAAAASALHAEFDLEGSQAVKNRRVVLPDGSLWAFAAFMTGLEFKTPIDDKMTGTATFKITGAPTFTQA
jgi:predicted secreted protein